MTREVNRVRKEPMMPWDECRIFIFEVGVTSTFKLLHSAFKLRFQ
jgi:hypothetical protein